MVMGIAGASGAGTGAAGAAGGLTFGTVAGGVGLALGLGSAISGIFGSSKQKKQAKKIRREGLVQANLGRDRLAIEMGIQDTQRIGALRQNRLEALQSSREAAKRRAEILSAATAAGVGLGSSGVQGARSATQSQLGFNIGQITNTETMAQNIFGEQRKVQGIQGQMIDSNQRASRAASKAGTAAANTGMIQTAFGVGAGIFDLFAGTGGAGPSGSGVGGS